MKQYRHKTLWWIAKQDENIWYWYRLWKVNGKNCMSSSWTSKDYSKDWRIIERYNNIAEELIENSQDWEELEEDVFSNMRNEYISECRTNSWNKIYKDIIRKHLWITRDDIVKWLSDPAYTNDVAEMFEKRWLLID